MHVNFGQDIPCLGSGKRLPKLDKYQDVDLGRVPACSELKNEVLCCT